ncbi:hypothetical protein GPUN_0861 [Glaciecola punicea ACAM 611]|jgi:hypothetical protein|uniref:DUF2987 domain-containing protein n=1 Tax=Glaciecola punicea ACAM 611 TaxID=1121923 RepID=H5T9L9_9ALTE|nr:DUF2987 domain-containing protein [Glaciecola punicea]GAB54996.1 hypothetical protein GPUN_0861 [Glaciecola punicea ACAM 611]
MIVRIGKTFAISLTIVIMSLSASKTAKSEELQVAYKTFYSHVKKLDSQETNALQFAFGFMNIRTKSLCQINSARISTEKQQIPIEITPEYRFTLPSERALRLADAVVILDLTEPSNICDISVQLETKPEHVKSSYTSQELDLLYDQFATFFDDIGGFMSFMMPEVDGLTIQFKDKNLTAALSNGMQIKDGKLILSSNELPILNNVILPSVPLRITAKTSR